jgi:hypothetical protein
MPAESLFQDGSILPIRIYIMYSYEFIESKEQGKSALIFKDGPYQSVIWTFLNGRVILKNPDGTPLDLENTEEIPIDFKYEVLYNPKELDLKTIEFKNAIGDVFMDILQNSIDGEQYRLVDENRNDNSEEFNT